MTTYSEFVEKLVPTVLRGVSGIKYIGMTMGVFDAIAEAASQGLRAPFLSGRQHIDSALPLLGQETGIETYPLENETDHRLRLLGKWDTWTGGAADQQIEFQFAAAGYPGAQVLDPDEITISPGDYWSHFLVFFPTGTFEPGTPDLYDSAKKYGTGRIYGAGEPLTQDILGLFKRLICTWKPADWIPRQLVFQSGTTVYGFGGVDYGDSGVTYGSGNFLSLPVSC